MRALAPGTILDGRHRVDEPIGSGGFATVYAGLHLTLGVRVAIKVLHVDGQLGPEQQVEMLSAFVEEARLVTRLRHDHVVRTLDQGVLQAEADGRAIPYVVLEWCGDESLKDRLREQHGEPMPLVEAYAIIDAVTDAMAHAHDFGIVHRDIKPGNVMLARGPSGEIVPRVIDFGIAKLFENDDRTSSGQTMSRSAGKFTPAYAAPEQLAGLRTGPWTDVHAIGLLFFELVTGRSPFASGASLGGVDPERPTPGRCGVDVGAFEAVIARAVSLRPADRHADARELRRALHDAARAMSFSVPRLPLAAPARRAPIDRSKGEALAAADGTSTESPISQTARTAAVPRRNLDVGSDHARSVTRRSSWLAALALTGVAALGGTAIWLAKRPTGKSAANAPRDSPSISAIVAVAPSMYASTATSPSGPASALAIPPPSTFALPSPSTETLATQLKPVLGAPKHLPSTSASIAAPEPSHAPIASVSKGVGGIVVQPPF